MGSDYTLYSNIRVINKTGGGAKPTPTHKFPVPTYNVREMACADLEGGQGGPDSPWNLQSLISPIYDGNIKISNFHICSLPQLYVKQNQSYLRLDLPPPLEIFSGSAPEQCMPSIKYLRRKDQHISVMKNE